MKILGIETATSVTSVAICEDDVILGHFMTDTKILHSKILFPMITALLETTSCQLKEIDLLAASCGPGSFTGLRVGLSAVKGFAVALNKPVAAVSSLEGLAFGLCGCLANQKALICAVIDARCSNVYAGIFRLIEKRLKRVEEDQRIEISELQNKLDILTNKEEKVVLVGNAAKICYNERQELQVIEGEKSNPSAVSVCQLAKNQECWCKPGELTPQYLKSPSITQKL